MSEIRTRLQGGTPFFPNMLNNGSVEVCLKEDVDKVLAEKDKEIAMLKERICNGDVSRLTWIDTCIAQDKEITELEDKCQMHNFFWDGCGFAKRGFKNSIAVSEAFDRLETENRKLKRALWLARAERAKTEHLSKIMYSTLFRDFIAKWVNVERKCRAKAEEYK